MQNVIVYSLGEEHDNDCKNAFIKGYQSNNAQYTGNIDIISFSSLNQALSFASTNNYQSIIYSQTGAQTLTGTVNNYYPNVICFIPAGDNKHNQVFFDSILNNNISTVITGCTDDKGDNVTGYNVEFIDIDPISSSNLSSYSNGYIAGKIAYIKDWYRCSNWQARYIARQTASNKDNFSDENGYGIINIHDALNTYLDIPTDPILNLGEIGSIEVNRNENHININVDEVVNATNYKIYRNDELIFNNSNNNYTDIIIPQAEFFYKYKACNAKQETEFSKESKIVYKAYEKFYYN